MLGYVKWYDDARGYGYILAENGDDLFVHRANIRRADTEEKPTLYIGEQVSFEVQDSSRGHLAVNIVTLDR